MTEDVIIEEIEEYDDYYEEEIISSYDTGLSTILEGDDESCSSSHSDSPEKGNLSPGRMAEHANLTPTGLHASWGHSSHQQLLALVSPTLFSPMAEARKLKLSSYKSPLIGSKPKYSPSPGGRGNKVLSIANIPLVFTNLETGEELLVAGDDDEYTFVSCSDTESIMGMSQSFLDDSFTQDESLYNHDSEHSDSPTSIYSNGCNHYQHHYNCHHHHKLQVIHPKLDFEATKKFLEDALERRMKMGKLGEERLDYIRRRLRYDLQRKMIQERLNHCLIPSKA